MKLSVQEVDALIGELLSLGQPVSLPTRKTYHYRNDKTRTGKEIQEGCIK